MSNANKKIKSNANIADESSKILKLNKKFNKIKKFLCVFFILLISQSFYVSAGNDCNSCAAANGPGACQCNSCCNDCTFSYWGKTFLQPRSQNTNTARRAVGNHNFRHRFYDNNSQNESNSIYEKNIKKNINNKNKRFASTFTVTPEYGQSFKPYHIAQYFFSADTLNFSGSMFTGRAQNNILADYFGLSPAFDGSISFSPQIKTFLTDFDLLLEFKRGIYMQMYTPLVKTGWQMRMCSSTEQSGSDVNYPAGYMAEGEITPPASSIPQALGGGLSFGDVIEGINYGKFSRCQLETTKLADITFLLGWIFLNRENGYVGVNAQVTVPTGTRPKNEYIFEPIAGNGHHWEFGIGFTGQALIWEKDDNQNIYFHFDANFGDLITTCQHRSFDFNCKFFSRYILLKEFDPEGNYLQLVPAINVTTLKCNVKVNFQMDINLMLAYNKKNWEFDFGYNGWLRSHEEISLIDRIPDNIYALKGIQGVGGLDAPLTQSTATIYGNSFDQQANVADANSPIFICTADLDLCSASNPKVTTHKFYSHLSHKWENEDRRFTPYLGGGSQIEFESVNPRFEYPYKNTLYQWALWLKMGLAYN